MRDDVGEVILALCVVTIELLQQSLQQAAGHRHDAGVHLVDPALGFVGIALFHNALHVRAAVTHNAPVAVRILQPHAQQSERSFARLCHQGKQCGRFQQRHVAIQNQNDAVFHVSERRQTQLHGVPGAVLLSLQHPLRLRAGPRVRHCLAAVTVDDNEARRVQRPRGGVHMLQKTAPAQRMQHFGLR